MKFKKKGDGMEKLILEAPMDAVWVSQLGLGENDDVAIRPLLAHESQLKI